jgi:hypothetical protein
MLTRPLFRMPFVLKKRGGSFDPSANCPPTRSQYRTTLALGSERCPWDAGSDAATHLKCNVRAQNGEAHPSSRPGIDGAACVDDDVNMSALLEHGYARRHASRSREAFYYTKLIAHIGARQ